MQGPTTATNRSAAAAAPSKSGERGAVLVHAVIAILGLISFSALVVDYGVLWAARRQAQNAADAGAMAAAVSLAFVDINNQGLARTSAMNTARQNLIWGAQPDITDADVTFPACPPGSPGAGTNACVKVEVFRNQRADGNPLPTIFGRLIGVADQGVKATATAEVLYGSSSTCVKPWAIPDKWQELNGSDTIWDPDDEFNRYDIRNTGALLSPADLYIPATDTDPGTGFTRTSVLFGGADYGRQITLKNGGPHDTIAPGWFFPIVVDPDCVGGDCYREAIANCAPLRYADDDSDYVTVEPGNMQGPTRQGMQDLIDLDPNARWDTTLNRIVGSCVNDPTPCSTKSPRLVAVPVFDPDEYQFDQANGRTEIRIVKIMGFFIEQMIGDDVVGRLCYYPGDPYVDSDDDTVESSRFVVSIALVR